MKSPRLDRRSAHYCRRSTALPLPLRAHLHRSYVRKGEASHVDGGWRGSTQTMAQQLIGQDPRDVDACFEGIRRSYIFRGGMAGLGISALTGLEIALWDLAGKAQGVPVYRLLGGKFRDRVRLYVDSAMTNCQERAEEARSKGFTAIKFDLDDAGNPHKADAWNWSVTPGELEIMVDQPAIRSRRPHMDWPSTCTGATMPPRAEIAHELKI